MRTVSTSEKYSCALPSFNRRCDRRNICAHHDSSCNRIKKLGLHYIDFSDSTPRTKRLTPKTQNQNYQFRPKRDELGLAVKRELNEYCSLFPITWAAVLGRCTDRRAVRAIGASLEDSVGSMTRLPGLHRNCEHGSFRQRWPLPPPS